MSADCYAGKLTSFKRHSNFSIESLSSLWFSLLNVDIKLFTILRFKLQIIVSHFAFSKIKMQILQYNLCEGEQRRWLQKLFCSTTISFHSAFGQYEWIAHRSIVSLLSLCMQIFHPTREGECITKITSKEESNRFYELFCFVSFFVLLQVLDMPSAWSMSTWECITIR